MKVYSMDLRQRVMASRAMQVNRLASLPASSMSAQPGGGGSSSTGVNAGTLSHAKAVDHADARAALADTIGGKNVRTEHAVRLLAKLLNDATYAVCRASARAMAKLDRSALKGICLGWAKSGRTDLRKRAAETSGWLADAAVDPPNIAVHNDLLVDAEHQVRQAAEQSLADSRRRHWADFYLGKFQKPATEANDFVFATYPYGRALSHIADDMILRNLGKMILNYELAPNIRHWFAQLLKEAEKNWTKTTKEWLQPWLPWSGT
jgi:hypothetical protein